MRWLSLRPSEVPEIPLSGSGLTGFFQNAGPALGEARVPEPPPPRRRTPAAQAAPELPVGVRGRDSSGASCHLSSLKNPSREPGDLPPEIVCEFGGDNPPSREPGV